MNLAPGTSEIPPALRSRLDKILQTAEYLLAWFESDLNESLQFSSRFLVLTSERILLFSTTGEPPQEWNRTQIAGVRTREQNGLGKLELLASDSLLVTCRYTAAQGSATARFVLRCNTELAKQRGEKLDLVVTVCPSCGAVLTSGESECPSCSVTRPAETRSLFRLRRFAKGNMPYIVLGLLLTVAGNSAALVGPYITMHLLDDVLIPAQNAESLPSESIYLVAPYLIGLFVAATLAWILNWSRTYVLARVSENISAGVRNFTYAHLQRLSLEYFGGKRTGDLMSRISSDSDRICTFLSTNLIDFVNDVLNIFMTSIVLFAINPYLALFSLLPFPAIAWLSQLVRSRLRQGFALAGRAWSGMVSVLADTIPGIRVVKAFAQESREVERFREANAHVLEANDRVNRVWSFFTPLITLLTEFGLLVVWAFGAWAIAGGSLKAGVLVAFIQYISRFYGRLDSMSRMLAATERTAAATHRIFEILDRHPTVAEPVKPVMPGRLEGRIEIKGVRFAYGPREVIKGIDLTVEPGEMIGLVGPSGAGKSTLVNLVCRFFDVASGAIFVDGHDIRSFPIEAYRRNIGIVLQDPFLFYGRPSATRREMIDAAKAAKAHEFIMRLPDGYDSLVGERGQALSGGERQRISIARAILTDPRILILDEATSSVDTETEREIQGALDNLTRGRTTLAIAHRLSTLRNANRIVVMERGQITEMGTHDDLLERAGTYARLHAVQQVDPKAQF